MLFLILICFGFGFSVLLWGRSGKKIFPFVTTLLPAACFLWFLKKIPEIKESGFFFEKASWVPQLGIDLNFRLDGLSLIFSLMITGIGALVFWYSSSYMKGHKYLTRFYLYLCVFMAAMLGMVLADNLITLFVFWELTSISSFFLIGFNNEEGASRRSALNALLITGTGGFLLLAGILLLGAVTGTYSISAMYDQRELIINHPSYPAIAILFFLGAFTKSAQFPFHFWLPGAMKAPTPVSTYLHSATMVKAGVFLLLKFSPILGGTVLWNHTLVIVGGITMLSAAVTVLFKRDLKEILAYTTVASLGMMIFLTGIGTPASLLAALVFIIAHAMYKAALFLITGIIDHQTGTRDIRRLRGLKKVLMPVAIAGFAAAFISGGVPPTLGFISKDLSYEAAMAHPQAILLLITAVVTNIFLFYGGFVAGVKPFAGTIPATLEKVNLPPAAMWLPPAILAASGVFFGLAPGILQSYLTDPAMGALRGGGEHELKLWHGFNLVLLLSAITITSGLLLFYFTKSASGSLQRIDRQLTRLAPEKLYEAVIPALKKIAAYATRAVQNGYLRRYIFITILFTLVLLLFIIFNRFSFDISTEKFGRLSLFEFTVIGIMIVAIVITLTSRSRLFSVSALGILGFSICTIFVFYSAPDLAMTQFSVDILTVILFVFVLFRIPKILKQSRDGPRYSGILLSVLFGATITFVCLKVLGEPVAKDVSKYYSDHAYTLAKGKNIVNVILVDFRGMDTLIEICVLIVAAIGVFSLIKITLKETY